MNSMTHPGWTGPPGDRHTYFVEDRTKYLSGGLGVVYRASIASDRLKFATGTTAAVKMFTGDISADRFEKLRLRSAALSAVQHPNVAQHIEVFTGPPFAGEILDERESSERFCVHVWVDGSPLSELCGTATAEDILRWGEEVGQAIDHLHHHPSGPFAHRDIHPRNIIVSKDDRAVLIDYDTILVDNPLGVRTSPMLPGTSFAPVERRPGIKGAQADDRCSLARTVLFMLAVDSAGRLPLADAGARAQIALTGVAADPQGVVETLQSVIAGNDPGSAAIMFSRVRRATGHKRILPRLGRRSRIALVIASGAAVLGGAVEAGALTTTSSASSTTNLPSQSAPAASESAVSTTTVGSSEVTPVPTSATTTTGTVAGAGVTSSPQADIVGSSAGKSGKSAPSPAPAAPTTTTSSPSPMTTTTNGPVVVTTPVSPARPLYAETTGGGANTWADPSTALGTAGPGLASFQTVDIACATHGFRVTDGNTWWYQIASAPWNYTFYVSADVFYNNGAVSGSLHGTPFFDPKIPIC